MNALERIDLRTLQIFLTLMAERSVTQTSLRVGVSQPAITQALNRLRQGFGDPLLVRGPSGMTPTPGALVLEQKTRAFLDSLAALQAARAEFDPRSETRDITLTMPEYLELLLVPRLMNVLRATAPGIGVRVRAPDGGRVAEWMASGEVDFRLGWVRDPQPSVRSLPLFEDEVVLVCGRRNTQLDGPLTLDDYTRLAHIRLVGTGHTTSGRVIDEVMRQHGASVRVGLSTQSLVAMLGALESSDMVATVPRLMALRMQSLGAVKVVAFPGPIPRVSNGLYWHERAQRDVVHQWFRSVLVDAVKDEVALLQRRDLPAG